jgi:cell division protein FtsL
MISHVKKTNLNRKKSQIFIFDLILSVVILIVSIGIVLTYSSTSTTNSNLYNLNLEIMEGLTETKINDLNDDVIRRMFVQEKIKNIENSIAQQLGEFYYLGNLDYSINVSSIFITPFLKQNMNFNMTLINDTGGIIVLYNKTNSNIEFEDAEISTSIDRSVFGIINRTDSFGPYILNIKLWV